MSHLNRLITTDMICTLTNFFSTVAYFHSSQNVLIKAIPQKIKLFALNIYEQNDI